MMRWIVGLVLTCLPFFLFGQTTEMFTLKNGLTVMVLPNHRAQVAVLQVWYKVGGSYEQNGTTGISHVLEHMMFQGTTHADADSFNRIITEHGGIQNAMTTNDFTMYYEEVPSRFLSVALSLEADRMQNLKLTQAHFQNEMQVVKTEKRMRFDTNPQGLLYQSFMSAAHISNPYHQPTIGWQSDLDHLQLSDVKVWYDKWYAPNNALLVIAGDINSGEVKKQVEQLFGFIPQKIIPVLKPRPEQNQLGERFVKISAPANVPMLMMGFNTPNYKNNPKEAAALTMLNAILGQDDSSRLQKGLIQSQQTASMVESNYDPFTLHDDLLTLVALPAQGVNVDKLKASLLRQISLLQTTLVTQAELNRAKAQINAQEIYDEDSLINQANKVGALEVIGLPYQTKMNFLASLDKVTSKEIQIAARKYLTSANETIGLLQPNKIKPMEVQNIKMSVLH